MKKKYIITFLLFFTVITSFVQAQDYSPIKSGVSDCHDVEKMFKIEACSKSITNVSIEDKSITFYVLPERCEYVLGKSWNLSAKTVVGIRVKYLKPTKIKNVFSDLSIFEYVYRHVDEESYENEDGSLIVETKENFIEMISYSPSIADKNILCQEKMLGFKGVFPLKSTCQDVGEKVFSDLGFICESERKEYVTFNEKVTFIFSTKEVETVFGKKMKLKKGTVLGIFIEYTRRKKPLKQLEFDITGFDKKNYDDGVIEYKNEEKGVQVFVINNQVSAIGFFAGNKVKKTIIKKKGKSIKKK